MAKVTEIYNYRTLNIQLTDAKKTCFVTNAERQVLFYRSTREHTSRLIRTKPMATHQSEHFIFAPHVNNFENSRG